MASSTRPAEADTDTIASVGSAGSADPTQTPAGGTWANIGPWMVVSGAVLVGVVVLAIAVGEEPYHIDELRQVRSYRLPLQDVVTASFSQTQPPLDSILNALAQRVIGVGDVQQRLLSVVFGVGSLGLLGALAVRGGLRFGAGVSVLLMALSPALVAVTAYARPYALPLFLVLTFLFATVLWLEERVWWAVPPLVVAALLLPVSRSLEPPIALGAAVVVLLVWRFSSRTGSWKGSVWIPIGAASGALVAVGVPVLLRLRQEVTTFTTDEPVTLSNLDRLATDVLEVMRIAAVRWPIALLIVVVALAWPPSRRLLVGNWWWWVLLAVPVGFAILFVVRTAPSQPYYLRYTFSWIPPFAVAAGSLVAAWRPSMAKTTPTRWAVGAASTVLVVVMAGSWATALEDDLTSDSNTDWNRLSDVIEETTTDDTIVLFDPVRRFGLYRTAFAGQPRYLDERRAAPLTLRVVAEPHLVPVGGPVALLLIGAELDVPGWERIRVADRMSLYLPEVRLAGRGGVRVAAEEFATALGPESGAALALAGASIAAADGDAAGACAMVDELTSAGGDDLALRIESFMATTGPGGGWYWGCPGRAG